MYEERFGREKKSLFYDEEAMLRVTEKLDPFMRSLPTGLPQGTVWPIYIEMPAVVGVFYNVNTKQWESTKHVQAWVTKYGNHAVCDTIYQCL